MSTTFDNRTENLFDLALREALPASEEFAAKICSNIELTYNIDLLGVYRNQNLTDREKISKAAILLKEAVLTRAYICNYEGFSADDYLHEGVDLSADLEIEPNIALSEADAKYLSTLEGDALKTYVYSLTKRFESMQNAKSPAALVAEMIAGGVISVGVPMAIGVIKGLIARQALKVAMLSGVKAIGMKTAIGAVVVVLAALLYYLLFENPKKILGLVINNTDESLIVNNFTATGGDLYMQHGVMVNFMQDNEDGLQSKKIQIRKRQFFEKDSRDNIVFAGIYFADRNIGFRGAEGLMLFSSTTNTNIIFAHMFAVPYTNDNRTNVDVLTCRPNNLESAFRTLYDENKQRAQIEKNGYKAISTVNAKKGGVVASLTYLEQQA